jgi:protocatechuate 3,4-dioxygenase beta subunit
MTIPDYRGRPLARPEEDIFDQGLAFDLETMLDRRQLLKLIGYVGLGGSLLALAGCGSSGSSDGEAAGGASVATTSTSGSNTTQTGGSATTAAGSTTVAECSRIPEETAGPFPGDGSNGPDVLSQSGVVRSDIRPSFGDFSGTADGVPLTIKLALKDLSSNCAALVGGAVYVWHCDRDGQYSLYTVTDQNYLRGVQEADGDGVVAFTSIFPGCYSGRWPHIHFEVYRSLDAATDDANVIATSQIALPEDACNEVYAADGYGQSVANLQQVSLQTDNVFGDDGGAQQLGTVTGSLDEGYVVELAVPVATFLS